MNQARKWLVVATVALLPVGGSAQTPARVFGNLSYPAKGNIQLDEGTVEIWLINGVDTTATNAHLACTPLDLIFPDDNTHYAIISLYGTTLAQAGWGPLCHSYVMKPIARWRPGEMHCVAWTWNGRHRSLYVDGVAGGMGSKGEVPKEVIVEGPLVGNLSRGIMKIGLHNSAIAVDEVRISAVARTPVEIAQSWTNAPRRDAFTLLLDHCDGGDAEVIAGASRGEFETNRCAVVDGRFGKAIQLWRE